MIALANTIPVARLTAIGTRNCAWVLVSNSIGVSPSAVVAVVRKIALKRRREASTMASPGGMPVSARNRLYWSTSTNESLITTPLNATTPKIEIKEML